MVTAIGLMSGTSLDGVDAAVIRTDGLQELEIGPGLCLPYPDDFRRRLARCLGQANVDAALQAQLTDFHAVAVRRLLSETGLAANDLEVVGFHGQTLLHAPAQKMTVQMGDGQRLADQIGAAVVGGFRLADVAAGGQGAPLVPLYHQALAAALRKPVAILNIGGVANLTFMAVDGEILAFDTGPGGALLDDWMREKTGAPFDRDGRVALSGKADRDLLAQWMGHPYFAQPAPKSLDRNAFAVRELSRLSVEDGAATLVTFTATAVLKGFTLLPETPHRLLVAGGGRKNLAFLAGLRETLPCPVDPVEVMGWDGDMLEAQAFAYLAVRSLRGLPLTLPSTTGVPQALTGGVAYLPKVWPKV